MSRQLAPPAPPPPAGTSGPPHAHHAPPGLVAGAFAAIYLGWGSTYLAAAFALESWPPFLLAGTRFLVAGSCLLLWQLARGATLPSARQWRDGAVSGTLLLLGGNGLTVWAQQTVPSGLTALVIAITPLWLVLIEALRPGGTRPAPLAITGIAVGLAGLAILVNPLDAAAQRHLPAAGVIALCTATFLWALGSIHSRSRRDPPPIFLAAAIQMLAGGAVLIAVALIRGEASGFSVLHLPAKAFGAFAYLVVIGSFVAFTAYAWLLKVRTPAQAGTYAFVNPVVAVFLGWLLNHEAVAPRTLAAAAVIVAGVALVNFAGRRH